MSCYLNAELANVVFGKGGSEKFAEYQEALNIKGQMDQVKSRMLVLEADYEASIEQLNDQKAKLQAMCKHSVTKRLPNPAGERTESECLLCGKVI